MGDYSSDPFFDNIDRLSMQELGLTAAHEPNDYFVSMMQRAEQDKMLAKQVKKHGMNYGIDPLTTIDGQGVSSTAGSTIPMDEKVARAQMLVLPGMKVNKPPDKDPTKRLRKAMGL